MGINLDTLASVAAIEGEQQRSVRIFAAAEALREAESLAQWTSADRALFGPYLLPLRTALGEAQYTAAWAEGRTMTMDEATEFALVPDAVCP